MVSVFGLGFFKISGVLGLALITLGVVTKNRRKQDVFYILGGLFLLGYSYSLGDLIFMSLQVIFTLAAALDFLTLNKPP